MKKYRYAIRVSRSSLFGIGSCLDTRDDPYLLQKRVRRDSTFAIAVPNAIRLSSIRGALGRVILHMSSAKQVRTLHKEAVVGVCFGRIRALFGVQPDQRRSIHRISPKNDSDRHIMGHQRLCSPRMVGYIHQLVELQDLLRFLVDVLQ